MSPKLCAFLFLVLGAVRAVSPSSLIQSFGLPGKLPFRRKTVNVRPVRIPKYMIQLYREITTRGGMLKHGMPYNVNAIRGVYTEKITKTSASSMELFFETGYLHNRFRARRDEIHVFMKHHPITDRDVFKPFVLRLQDIHTGKLIRVFKVPAFNHGWQALSLSGWIKRWLKEPASNKGIRLTVYRGRRKKPAPHNPFINFPEGKDPYLILFGDDSSDSLLNWKFLKGYPMNSVAGTARPRRDLERSRVVGALSSRSGRERRGKKSGASCRVVQKDVTLKRRKLNDQQIILEPQRYNLTQCPKMCKVVPRGAHSDRRGQPSSGSALQKLCCVPTKFRPMAFLVTEPSRLTVTFTLVPNIAPLGCKWSAG